MLGAGAASGPFDSMHPPGGHDRGVDCGVRFAPGRRNMQAMLGE